ncbi:MAG: hypothetical protein STSR0004_08240 [Peptococcaceae bacterium]
MDSTQIMTNIKLAGRLFLAYDVLTQALAACPPEILTNELKNVLEPEYKTKTLYRSKGSEAKKRIQEIILVRNRTGVYHRIQSGNQ